MVKNAWCVGLLLLSFGTNTNSTDIVASKLRIVDDENRVRIVMGTQDAKAYIGILDEKGVAQLGMSYSDTAGPMVIVGTDAKCTIQLKRQDSSGKPAVFMNYEAMLVGN